MAIKGKGRTKTRQPVRAPRRGPVPVPVPFARRRSVQVVSAFVTGLLVFWGGVWLTNGLRALRGRRPIYAVEFEGKRHDTGEKLGFLKATVEFALARPDLADAFREYLKGLKL